jgi:hypothetical protein
VSARDTAILAFLLSDVIFFLIWHAHTRPDKPDTTIYDLPPEKPDKEDDKR